MEAFSPLGKSVFSCMFLTFSPSTLPSNRVKHFMKSFNSSNVDNYTPGPVVPAAPSDNQGLNDHPLIREAVYTLTNRLWRDWRGALASALITVVLILRLPQDLTAELFSYRNELTELIATCTTMCVIWRANYVEHFLSPPVEPEEIVKGR